MTAFSRDDSPLDDEGWIYNAKENVIYLTERQLVSWTSGQVRDYMETWKAAGIAKVVLEGPEGTPRKIYYFDKMSELIPKSAGSDDPDTRRIVEMYSR